MNAVDCPDGLARCEAGVVSVSRVATVPQPCGGPPSRCNCPWEIVVANCQYGCAVEGVELEVDRSKAGSQLCAPAPDASVFARLTLPAPATAPCEEGQRYACSAGLTVECASRTTIGRCTRGCFAEGASIDDDRVSREGAFAILCSR